MHDWRCRTCVRSRSEGRLLIRKQVAARKAVAATAPHHVKKRAAAVIGLPLPKRRKRRSKA
jgi:hypothetical protein